MNKSILKISTFAKLALLSMVGVSSAQAEVLTSGSVAPSLKIDGFTAVNAYVTSQKDRQNGKGGPQPHIGVDVSNLFFTIMGASASGIEYMYRVTLETIPNTSTVITQNYLQFKTKIGTFQIGAIIGPEDSMVWDASKVIGGTGGFDGAYNNVYNMSAGVMRGNDILGDTGDSNKFVYYTPDMMGWQFGIAYTPSTAQKGDAKLDNQTNQDYKLPGNRGMFETKGFQTFDLRNVAIGLIYRKEMGKWSAVLSGAAVTGKSYFYNSAVNRIPFNNAKAYQLGVVLGYDKVRVGAGYLNNGKSHLPHQDNFTVKSVNLTDMNKGNAGHAWNLGAGYTMGVYQFGLSYQRTSRRTGESQKASSNFYTATFDVTPVKGLKLYTEVDYIHSRTNAAAVARETAILANAGKTTVGNGNNKAVIGIGGVKISF